MTNKRSPQIRLVSLDKKLPSKKAVNRVAKRERDCTPCGCVDAPPCDCEDHPDCDCVDAPPCDCEDHPDCDCVDAPPCDCEDHPDCDCVDAPPCDCEEGNQQKKQSKNSKSKHRTFFKIVENKRQG